MKQNLLYITIILLSIAFTRCCYDSHEDTASTPVKGSISVNTQNDLNNLPAPEASLTKANGETLEYTLEVWTRDDNPRRILQKTAEGDISGASFNIALIPGSYDMLFWADYDQGHYITSDLRKVELAEVPYQTDKSRDAFACVCKNITWDGNSINGIVLKRPLAKLNILNSQPCTDAENVSVTYQTIYTSYDVMTQTAANILQNVTVSFDQTTPGSQNIAEDFLFSDADETSASFSVNVGSETKTIGDIPLRTNYRTNVTADF